MSIHPKYLTSLGEKGHFAGPQILSEETWVKRDPKMATLAKAPAASEGHQRFAPERRQIVDPSPLQTYGEFRFRLELASHPGQAVMHPSSCFLPWHPCIPI